MIDRKLGIQLDEVLHHKDFQKLESGWRSLKFLVDRTDFRENIRIEMLNVSKGDLLEDFEDAPEIPKSGLYKTIYTSEYGQFGGQPYCPSIYARSHCWRSGGDSPRRRRRSKGIPLSMCTGRSGEAIKKCLIMS